jgi:hypothetical protein
MLAPVQPTNVVQPSSVPFVPGVTGAAISPSDTTPGSRVNSLNTPAANILKEGLSRLTNSADVKAWQNNLGRQHMGVVAGQLTAPHQIGVSLVKDAGDWSQHGMASGTLLVKPVEKLSLETNFGTVNISAKSAILLSHSHKALSVYDLHDDGRGSVELVSAGRHFKLEPGDQLTITRDFRTAFTEINPLSSIRHAELKTHALKDGACAFTGTFSIRSAISFCEPLRSDETVQKEAAAQRPDQF